MKNEISNILKLIETGNTIKALEEAKNFNSQNKNNLDGIKLLAYTSVSYTHLRAHETSQDLVCRLLLEKKK